MINNLKTICFPSIPNPPYKTKRSTELFKQKKTKASSLTHKSMNYDDMKHDERIISHFVIKYLARKEMYEGRYL